MTGKTNCIIKNWEDSFKSNRGSLVYYIYGGNEVSLDYSHTFVEDGIYIALAHGYGDINSTSSITTNVSPITNVNYIGSKSNLTIFIGNFKAGEAVRLQATGGSNRGNQIAIIKLDSFDYSTMNLSYNYDVFGGDANIKKQYTPTEDGIYFGLIATSGPNSPQYRYISNCACELSNFDTGNDRGFSISICNLKANKTIDFNAYSSDGYSGKTILLYKLS